MFAISDTAIDARAARETLLADEAGGFVCFEGWVRNRNLGREVTRLEFEAEPNLAANEFAKLEAEAMTQFDIVGIHCIHRSGLLEIGEMAVWIGVTAQHRDAAFTGCRFVIDELKARLPIWKKEHYTDGDSGWLNHP